jgi:hypothetical protein
MKLGRWVAAVLCVAVLAFPPPSSGLVLRGGGSAASVASAQITTFQVFNTGGTSTSGQSVNYVQPFATGDLPSSGSALQVRKNDGVTVVTTQQDYCSQWAQDSSEKACQVSFIEPDTMTGASITGGISGTTLTVNSVVTGTVAIGQVISGANVITGTTITGGSGSSWTVSPSASPTIAASTPLTLGGVATYQLWKVAGSPNTTPNVTKSNITSNTDFKLQLTACSGCTLDTGTWNVSLNTILNSCSNWPSWGTSPTCGYEILGTGPNRYRVHGFSYLVRASDSAIHKWIKADIYVDFWGSGSTPCPCAVSVMVKQANVLGAISGGTVGASTEPAYTYDATLLNGSNTLYVWGGASDTQSRTISISSSSVNTGTQKFAFPANWLDASAGNAQGQTAAVPVTLSCTGGGCSLPSGLSTGTVYWVESQFFDTGHYYIGPTQFDLNNGTTTPFTTQGSGTIVFTFHAGSFPRSGWAGTDSTGRQIWVNSGGTVTTAPPILPIHNYAYLTNQSKAVPPFLQGQDWIGVAASTATAYPLAWYIGYYGSTTGDGSLDERISYVSYSNAMALVNPYDISAQSNARVNGQAWSFASIFADDNTVGKLITLNNGPAKNGVAYTNLGTPYPNELSGSPAVQDIYPVSAPSPPFFVAASGAAIDTPAQGGITGDVSHMPAPWVAPYLQTADQVYIDIGTHHINSSYGGVYLDQTLGGTTYYRPIMAPIGGQVRGAAWATRIVGQANYLIAASDPVSAYVHDMLADSGDWAWAWVQCSPSAGCAPANALPLGWEPISSNLSPVYPVYEAEGWEDDHLFVSLGMEAWRGEISGYTNFVENHFAKWAVGRGDQISGTGCLYAVSDITNAVWSPTATFTGSINSNGGIVAASGVTGTISSTLNFMEIWGNNANTPGVGVLTLNPASVQGYISNGSGGAGTTLTVTQINPNGGSSVIPLGFTLSGTSVTGGTTLVSQLTNSGVSTGVGSTFGVTASITGTQLAITATPGSSVGTILPGATVTGAGVTGGTVITANQSVFPDYTGTYTINNSQTVGSESMTVSQIGNYNTGTYQVSASQHVADPAGETMTLSSGSGGAGNYASNFGRYGGLASDTMYGVNASNATLMTSFTDLWNYTKQYYYNATEWGSPGTFSCPSIGSGMFQNQGHNGLPDANSENTMYVGESAAMGAVLGVTNAATLYTDVRTMQYGNSPPLTFTHQPDGSGGFFSAPKYAFGPLGATQ